MPQIPSLPIFLQTALLLSASNVFIKLDYLWAGLCILGAVYFAFR